jgi:hypothetical protein
LQLLEVISFIGKEIMVVSTMLVKEEKKVVKEGG